MVQRIWNLQERAFHHKFGHQIRGSWAKECRTAVRYRPTILGPRNLRSRHPQIACSHHSRHRRIAARTSALGQAQHYSQMGLPNLQGPNQGDRQNNAKEILKHKTLLSSCSKYTANAHAMLQSCKNFKSNMNWRSQFIPFFQTSILCEWAQFGTKLSDQWSAMIHQYIFFQTSILSVWTAFKGTFQPGCPKSMFGTAMIHLEKTLQAVFSGYQCLPAWHSHCWSRYKLRCDQQQGKNISA